ncbi:peptidase E [Nocardioides sp. SR21]|uniref:Type 1 glutamine amidotransferase-like domain-containing protein n=1 Tax=Nocardioides sp. SR21 TaxID=2919501 RepID=UPI001FAA1600|nr:peptidase E [Nocardioides sp. SR21]
MPADQPTIVATSIGFSSMDLGEWDWRLGPVYRYAADLAQAGPSPKVCILATALGDDPTWLTACYAAFGRAGFRVTHLALFPRPNTDDVRRLLLEQDLIWVAGGSVANLLALWRTHGLEPILRECWEKGVVLTGVSAGSVCWFTGGTTDSFGLPLRPVTDGLGFLPYSNSPHHDAEEQRRPAITRLLAEERLPECYATDNGAALTFFGTDLHEAVSDTDGAHAWHLVRSADGAVVERQLPTRRL